MRVFLVFAQHSQGSQILAAATYLLAREPNPWDIHFLDWSQATRPRLTFAQALMAGCCYFRFDCGSADRVTRTYFNDEYVVM